MVVSTTSGFVKGIDQEGTMAWLGIPYAKVERFMPPLPVDKWQGVRACDHWGPQAMQQTNREMSEEEMSEKNSCVLNVWTTDRKGKKPVMVGLHGGGFDSGTSAWDPGMALAKKDVVVVGVNHRLNILGFFLCDYLLYSTSNSSDLKRGSSRNSSTVIPNPLAIIITILNVTVLFLPFIMHCIVPC